MVDEYGNEQETLFIISDEQAEAWLRADLAHAEEHLAALRKEHYEAIKDAEKDIAELRLELETHLAEMHG